MNKAIAIKTNKTEMSLLVDSGNFMTFCAFARIA